MSKTNLKSKQIFKYIIQISIVLILSLTLSLSSFAATDGNVGDANAGGQGNHDTISIKGVNHYEKESISSSYSEYRDSRSSLSNWDSKIQ